MTERGELQIETTHSVDIEAELALLSRLVEDTDQLDRKNNIIANLARILADSDSGDAAAERLVVCHEQTDASSRLSVYAYWVILRQIQADNPQVQIPTQFLTFFRDLAEVSDDEDAIFAALLASSNINTLESVAQSDTDYEEAMSILLTYDLVTMSCIAREGLSELQKLTKETLSNNGTVLHTQDANLLIALEGNPDRLLAALQSHGFMTTKGNVAACVQQDIERVILRTGKPHALLRDMEEIRFTTDEGMRVAGLQHDSDRLNLRKGDPRQLLEDLLHNRFRTVEGEESAKIQQDNERLVLRNGAPDDLLKDINNNRFFTPEGLGAAEIQQDADRLALLRGNIGQLQSDLWAKRFLTSDGIKRAQALFDSREF
jgi:hypothetical protein